MSAVSEHKANPEDSPSKEHLYVWLDILGFSEEVAQSNKNGDELLKLLRSFKNQFITETIKVGKGKKIKLEGRMISDGIILDLGEVLSVASKLKEIFKVIGKRQFDFMVKHKKLIRGGIAMGKTLIPAEKEHYISSGLVRAYGTESRDIHWPIIGITKSEIKKIQDSLQIKDDFDLERTFNKNGEEIYFIDFLASVEDKEDFKLKLEKITSKNCRTEKGKTKSNVIDKYTWLYRYYNSKFHPEHISHKLFEGVFL